MESILPKNLQTAALFVSGIGKIETHIAQPTKKANVFNDTNSELLGN